jgi:tRNA threonylcarbamoyladenosine biosynthesis protein TsaE
VLDPFLPAETASPDETIALGTRLAAAFEPGDVVALYGDLGAGKTHLTKGICAGLGVSSDEVASPTFRIVHEYHGARFPIYHFDAYRIERPEELFEIGYEAYFFGEGICLVEWPERIEALLPAQTIRLRLAHLGSDRRRVSLDECLNT